MENNRLRQLIREELRKLNEWSPINGMSYMNDRKSAAKKQKELRATSAQAKKDRITKAQGDQKALRDKYHKSIGLPELSEDAEALTEKQWAKYSGVGGPEDEGAYYSHPKRGLVARESGGWQHYKPASDAKGTFQKTHVTPFKTAKDARRHARSLSSK
jgi:hypothetical protein